VLILRALLISPDSRLRSQLPGLLSGYEVSIVSTLEYYPSDTELARLLRTVSPQLILLDAALLADACSLAASVEKFTPGLPVIGIGKNPSPEVLLALMRSGVREYLPVPFDPSAVQAALERVRDAAERAPRLADLAEHVFAFLPSKAGVGASTVALNLSAALALTPETRVLLADFDLNSGMIAFMLKLESPYSVAEAAENAFQMDENLWRQLISTRDSLDVLPSGKINVGFRIEPAQVRSLLDFVRRYYKAVCLDLSGNLEKYSVEIMHEARLIFLVVTAELPSLHLAREKLSFLRSIELADRVQIVLNRSSKRDIISAEEVERLLGQPIFCRLPNDYRGIHKALAEGRPVDWKSELGREFQQAAARLLAPVNPGQPQKRKFVEYFSLVPARYTVFPGK